MARVIESVASSLENNMGQQEMMQFISAKACIFKIPSILRRHNEEAFIPNAFSIGPFHHDKHNPRDTQKIKLKYLEGLLTRTGNRKTMLRQCISEIKTKEKEARECYAEEIDMSEEEFVEMLVLDGCFIIELLRKNAEEEKDGDDPIFSMSCMIQFLYQDLILLENQIPWFVLERLFSSTGGPSQSKSLVIELVLKFFGNIFSSEQLLVDDNIFTNQDIKHILDLLRSSLVLQLPLPECEIKLEKQSQQVQKGWQPFPSATTIKESGIKFMKVKSTTILDVKFVNGTLKMPSILIQETIEPVFRNLISYEQCYPNCQPRITSYAILLDNLINTLEDLDELLESGILINWVNPQDTTQFFKMLYHDAYVKEFYYQKLCSQVNDYRQQWWPKWRAFYYHNYFGKPWAIVSQIFAGIILVLSILQTLYAILGAGK
ncbi:hypothetical protein SLEP1_g19640 [Rubroshorea leprosula]|uniref:Uncharacterized protein n=1 Tax=Rubroshorea leprosula TaxID=152421 RepID=A0AAV5J010_9ROSI|nr:hypothetical protein SLEP1_g19640 [Rubroshorea leprosula]